MPKAVVIRVGVTDCHRSFRVSRTSKQPRLLANLCATPPRAGKVFDHVSPLASSTSFRAAPRPFGVKG